MKSFKYLLYLFFILNLSILNINAKDLTPTSSLLASGGVIDLVLNNDKLYASTAASSVDIFDIKTQERIDSIKMPKIKDFLGDVIDSKIYSVDVLENNIRAVSESKDIEIVNLLFMFLNNWNRENNEFNKQNS